MFVIGDAFFEIEHHMGRDVGIKTLLSTTLRVVGPSVTLTSITNAAGFFLSAVIPIPAIRNFAIQVSQTSRMLINFCIMNCEHNVHINTITLATLSALVNTTAYLISS